MKRLLLAVSILLLMATVVSAGIFARRWESAYTYEDQQQSQLEAAYKAQEVENAKGSDYYIFKDDKGHIFWRRWHPHDKPKPDPKPAGIPNDLAVANAVAGKNKEIEALKKAVALAKAAKAVKASTGGVAMPLGAALAGAVLMGGYRFVKFRSAI